MRAEMEAGCVHAHLARLSLLQSISKCFNFSFLTFFFWLVVHLVSQTLASPVLFFFFLLHRRFPNLQVFAARLGPELKHNAYGVQYVFNSPGSFHHMGCAVCFALEIPLPKSPGAQSKWRREGIQPQARHTWREEPGILQLPLLTLSLLSILHSPINCLLPQPWPTVPAIVKGKRGILVELPERRAEEVISTYANEASKTVLKSSSI